LRNKELHNIDQIKKANKSYHKIIGLSLIFVGALTIRIYPVVNSPEKIRAGFGPFGDTHFYQRVAYNLYKGNGFSATYDDRAYGLGSKNENLEYEPTVTRGPVYPLFLCTVYKFIGNEEDMKSVENWHRNLDKVRIVQCIVDSAICLLVFFIVRLIYPSAFLPAFISAVLYCFNFYNIFYTKALLSESITTFLIASFIFFCVFGLKITNKLWGFLTGVILGLVVLSRLEYALFMFVLTAYIYFVNRQSPLVAIKKCAIFILGSTIIISPWTVRNYLVFKEPILVSTGTLGYNLWQGTFETNKTWGKWGNFPNEIFASENEKAKVVSLNKSFNNYLMTGSIRIRNIDRVFMKLALNRIRNDSIQCLVNWVTKIPRLWYQSYIQMYVYKETSGGFFIFYFLFGLYAFFTAKKWEKILMLPICLLFIYITIIFLPLHVEPRYGVVLMPGIISLAGIGIWKAISNIFDIKTATVSANRKGYFTI
jgi:hypothetical protein